MDKTVEKIFMELYRDSRWKLLEWRAMKLLLRFLQRNFEVKMNVDVDVDVGGRVAEKERVKERVRVRVRESWAATNVRLG